MLGERCSKGDARIVHGDEKGFAAIQEAKFAPFTDADLTKTVGGFGAKLQGAHDGANATGQAGERENSSGAKRGAALCRRGLPAKGLVKRLNDAMNQTLHSFNRD
jgi:hypothetical protein